MLFNVFFETISFLNCSHDKITFLNMLELKNHNFFARKWRSNKVSMYGFLFGGDLTHHFLQVMQT
jgi:hypothetical protein